MRASITYVAIREECEANLQKVSVPLENFVLTSQLSYWLRFFFFFKKEALALILNIWL